MYQGFFGGDYAHVVELVEEVVGEADSGGVLRVEFFKSGYDLGDHAADFVVFLVVVSILDVVSTHNLFVVSSVGWCGVVEGGGLRVSE